MKSKYFFIIVFCLLCFMEISCLGLSKEPSSFRETWNTFSFRDKLVYITGFSEGITLSMTKLVPVTARYSDGGKGFSEICDLSNFLKGNHLVAIIEVIDDLYKDPANTYIPAGYIIEIACQKLKGEDIEPLLQEVRKKALP